MDKKERLYKCWYKHCPYHGKVLDSKAVKVGNKRYHRSCLETQEGLKKVRELYIEHIDPAVVMTQLNKALKTIVVDKKVDIEYLLFVIEYVIENGLEVKYPFALYYKITDFRIKRAFNEGMLTADSNSNLTIHS